MTGDKATVLWRDFQEQVLGDIPMTPREQLIAALCFWMGVSSYPMTTIEEARAANEAATDALARLLCDQKTETQA